MEKNIETAIIASLLAGNAIMEIYSLADLGVETKSDNSPITLADKAAHHIICEKLEATNIPILSEEGNNTDYETRKKWDKFWLVDPLDGTKEFIKRTGEFTVNIALIENQVPIMGVVYVPVSKTLYYTDEKNAFRATNISSISEITSLSQKLPQQTEHNTFNVVASVSHINAETQEFIQQLDTKGKKLNIVNRGSSLKLCMVAEGSADCYPRLGPTMEWDTAAGHAIVLKAGKTIVQLPNKSPMIYNKESLLNPWFLVY
ncbi:MAG TPA: 3'(2'),5'-bisphosphate nucleotidase CysQ [Prolixibacteraceae bacterium]|nr:3'(2'),5'-bisphosphate nucleotidase CysQ [Prolixibacteraceae bacterium]